MRVTSCVLVLSAMACSAQAEEPNLFYGYVQLMNNYIGRGLSQSVGDPSAQVEVDINPGSGIYGNISAVHVGWIDKIYNTDSVHTEVDGVLGYRELFGQGGEIRMGVLQLQFPGRYRLQSPPVKRPDTTEIFGCIGWKGVSARLNYDITDSFGTPDSRGSWYLDTNATRALGAAWSVAAHIGRRQSRGTDPVSGASNSARFSYTDYKLSATRYFSRGINVTLMHTWTTADPAIYTLNGYNVGGHHTSVVLEKDF